MPFIRLRQQLISIFAEKPRCTILNVEGGQEEIVCGDIKNARIFWNELFLQQLIL